MSQINPEASKMITKVVADFFQKVKKENDLSVILLKGHLLIEYYLNYSIIMEHDTSKRVDNLSFFDKVKILEQASYFDKNVIQCLFKLNDIRNNLSHELNYEVSESGIDLIGFNLGRDYLMEKFKKDFDNQNDLKDLFLWVIDKILWQVFYPVIQKMVAISQTQKEKENDTPDQSPNEPVSGEQKQTKSTDEV